MRAALMYGAGDVQGETVSDRRNALPTDAIVRVVAGCICGSDLCGARGRRPEAGVRDGGVISRVTAPQFHDVPFGFGPFMSNVTLTGGVAPARSYIPEPLPKVLDGSIGPGKVYDRTVDL
jgi:hypothetical protein